VKSTNFTNLLLHSAIDIIDESASRCLLRSSIATAEAARACAANAGVAAAAAAAAEAHSQALAGKASLHESPPTQTARGSGGASSCGNASLVSDQAQISSGSSRSSSSISLEQAGQVGVPTRPQAGSDAGLEGDKQRLTDWQTWVARHGWQVQQSVPYEQSAMLTRFLLLVFSALSNFLWCDCHFP
jgi:hypothetical protein